MFSCAAPASSSHFRPNAAATERDAEERAVVIENAFELIGSQPEFDFMSRLLRGSLYIAENFKTNFLAASLIIARLHKILVVLGDGKNGVIVRAAKNKRTISTGYLAELENVLHVYKKYFERYTQLNSAKYVVAGENICSKIAEFYERTQAAVETLTREFEVKHASMVLGTCPLDDIDISTPITQESFLRASMDSQFLISLAEERKIEILRNDFFFSDPIGPFSPFPPNSSFKTAGYCDVITEAISNKDRGREKYTDKFLALCVGVYDVVEYMKSTENTLAKTTFSFGSHSFIPQKAMRKFWKDCIPSLDGVDVAELCDQLHTYLTTGGKKVAAPPVGGPNLLLEAEGATGTGMASGHSTSKAVDQSAAASGVMESSLVVQSAAKPKKGFRIGASSAGDKQPHGSSSLGSVSSVSSPAAGLIGPTETKDIENLVLEFRAAVVEGAYKNIFEFDEEGRIDAIEITKLVRCVPANIGELKVVLRMICDRAQEAKEGTGGHLLCPPPPQAQLLSERKVITDALQETELQSLLFGNTGIVNITGAPHSGKTTQVLSAVHSACGGSAELKDVLWCNYAGAFSNRAIIARTVQQLCLRSCNASDANSCMSSLRRLLQSIRPGSTIVFDNIDINCLFPPEIKPASSSSSSSSSSINNSAAFRSLASLSSQQTLYASLPKTGADRFSSPRPFFESLVDLCQKMQKSFCFVFVTSSPLLPLLAPLVPHRAYKLAPIPEKLLESLAFSLLSEDPGALRTAAFDQPGVMVKLAAVCSLESIRKIAKYVDPGRVATKTVRVVKFGKTPRSTSPQQKGGPAAGGGDEASSAVRALQERYGPFIEECATTDLLSQLSPDAKLLASAICNVCAVDPAQTEGSMAAMWRAHCFPFDEALAWAISKMIFSKDMVRWITAWEELLERGWLEGDSDVGFVVAAPPLFAPHYTLMDRSHLHLQSQSHSASAAPRSIEQLRDSGGAGGGPGEGPGELATAAEVEGRGPCFPWERELEAPSVVRNQGQSGQGQAAGQQSLWVKYVKHWTRIVTELTNPSLQSARGVEILFKFVSHVDLALAVFSQPYFGAAAGARAQAVGQLGPQGLMQSEEEQQRIHELRTEEKDPAADMWAGSNYGRHLFQPISTDVGTKGPVGGPGGPGGQSPASPAVDLDAVKVKIDFDDPTGPTGPTGTPAAVSQVTPKRPSFTPGTIGLQQPLICLRRIHPGELQSIASKLAGRVGRLIACLYSSIEGIDLLTYVLLATGKHAPGSSPIFMHCSLDLVEQTLELGQVERSMERLDDLFRTCFHDASLPVPELVAALRKRRQTAEASHASAAAAATGGQAGQAAASRGPKGSTKPLEIDFGDPAASIPLDVYGRMFYLRGRLHETRQENAKAVVDYDAALKLWAGGADHGKGGDSIAARRRLQGLEQQPQQGKCVPCAGCTLC